MFLFVLKIERKIDFVKVDKYRKIYGKYLQLLFTSLDRAVNLFFILQYSILYLKLMTVRLQ
jgi:hypothetical protein